LKAAFPNAASGSLTAKAGQYLYVTFSVTDAATKEELKPHQAFVRLTNTATGVASYFVAKPDPSGAEAGRHKLELAVGDRKALRDAVEAGDYAVHVIVGDAALENPVEWKVAAVNLQPPAPAAKAPVPLYTTPLLHESDTALAPLREIAHSFRTPERRPHAVVSLVAACAVVAVLVGWVLYVLSLPGLRFSVPWASSLWVFGFHGSFAAVLGLFALYWLRLDMFTTLGYLALLAPVVAFFMHMLLSTLQKRDALAAAKATHTE
jgi:oligosaccharyltransferase complex subunit delta (ribophorin II)